MSDREYWKLQLRAAQKQRLYKREEYDVLSFFGELGGLIDSVRILGYFLTSAIVTRLLNATLISNAYRVQHYFLDETPYYDTSIEGRVSSVSSNSGSDGSGKDKGKVKEEKKHNEIKLLSVANKNS